MLFLFVHWGSVLAVQAALGANTYVISGAAETKSMQEMLPTLFNQLSTQDLMGLRRMAEAGAATGAGDADAGEGVEDFEEVANDEVN